MLSKERIIEIGKRYFKEGHNPDSVPFFVAAAEDCIKEALRAQADAGSKMHDAATLDAAITIVCNARDALGAGTEFPYDAQERSTVGPYLDGIEDKLRALYDTHSSAPAAQALSDGEIQALWNEACHDTPQKPGWCRHIRFARSIESAAPRLWPSRARRPVLSLSRLSPQRRCGRPLPMFGWTVIAGWFSTKLQLL